MGFLLFWLSLSIKPVGISRELLHTRPWLETHVLKTSFKTVYFLSAPVLSTRLQPWTEDTDNPACKRDKSCEGQLPTAAEDRRPHWTHHELQMKFFTILLKPLNWFHSFLPPTKLCDPVCPPGTVSPQQESISLWWQEKTLR